MRRNRIFNLFLLFFLTSLQSLQAQFDKLQIAPAPAWTISVAAQGESEVLGASGGYRYKLLDFQTNVETQERYKHLIVSILNSDGVQAMSDFSFEFDPAYQKIDFHFINIIRNGQTIKKLSLDDAQVIQREQSADRFLYDGNLSVVFNLKDVRVGDKIDYAFTLRGFNPVYNGKYTSYTNLNYQDPMDKIHKRLLVSDKRNLVYKSVNGAIEPNVSNANGLKVLTWNLSDVEQFSYDTNVPIWYDAQQSYHYSEFQDWSEVVDWALPLFKISKNDKTILRKELDRLVKKESKEADLLNIVRFVQDDIRYLGFETGLNTMKPYAPSKILDQRFGDCKDKSLLLVSLLKLYGEQAFPVLVHSSKGHSLPQKLPSPEVFNHCVVMLEWNGEKIFIDPTIQNQGGSLEYLSFPDYKNGLVLKQGVKELESMAFKNGPELIIQEMIDVKEIGSAAITVRSEYYGSKADYIRSYFNGNNMADIKREYVNFYSSLYPNVQLSGDIKFMDYDRNSTNKIIIEEYYEVPDIWRFTEDSSRQYFEVNSLILNSSLNYPGSPERTMPYFTPGKDKFFQKTTVSMYEDWGVTPINNTIMNEAFTYVSSAYGNGNEIFVDYEYETFRDFVSASQAAQVINDAKSVSNDLSFFIYKNSDSATYTLSWLNVMLLVLVLLLFVYMFVRYDKSEMLNPLPPKDRLSEEVFGGWLLLVMIGVSITPFYTGYTLFSESTYFNAVILDQLKEMEETFELYLIIEFELIVNSAFFLFSCYFAYCFFSKRTIIPKLAIVFYSTSFLIVFIDLMLLKIFVPEHLSATDLGDYTGQIVRSFFTAAVWIPYFLKSERVKKTFVRTPLLPKVKY